MSATPIIRPARPDDLDGVLALWTAVAEHHDAFTERVIRTTDNIALIRGFLDERIANGHVFVAESVVDADATSTLLGYVSASPDRFPLEEARRCAIINEIFVRESSRGQGIGHLLSGAILKRLRADGFDTVRISFYDANEGAGRLYLEQGFRPESSTLRIDLTPIEPGRDAVSRNP